MSSDRFHRAARDGLIDVLKDATRKDANSKDDDSMTPVLWASFEGKLDALRLLCGKGGDPDKCDQFGNTALHLASAKGHLHCVDFLVKFGVNIYALDIDKHTAKDLAAINNRDDILRYLDAATASFETNERKKAKSLKELAEKNCEKKVREYMKRQHRLENDYTDIKYMNSSNGAIGATNSSNGNGCNKSSKMLSTLKQKIWSSQGNLHKVSSKGGEYLQGGCGNGSTNINNMNNNGGVLTATSSATLTKFSDLVGGGSNNGSNSGSIASRTGLSQKFSKTLQTRPELGNDCDGGGAGRGGEDCGGFKIGEIEPDGKRTITSLTGLQRDSEILYVGTFNSNEEFSGKRGKISDVFEVEDTFGSDNESNTLKMGSHYGTLARSYSQPDILNDSFGDPDRSDNHSMDRSGGSLFNRPMLGSIAFRRSVTAALSQLQQPDAFSMETSSNATGTTVNKSSKSRSSKQQRLYLNLSDESDSDGDRDGYSEDDDDIDDDHDDHSCTPIQRFLAVWGLDEYLPIFQKQEIDLDTLMLLTEADLKSLSLPLGPFRKLTCAIQERKNALANPGIMQDSRL